MENLKRQTSVSIPVNTLRAFDQIVRGGDRSAAITRLMEQAIAAEEGEKDDA